MKLNLKSAVGTILICGALTSCGDNGSSGPRQTTMKASRAIETLSLTKEEIESFEGESSALFSLIELDIDVDGENSPRSSEISYMDFDMDLIGGYKNLETTLGVAQEFSDKTSQGTYDLRATVTAKTADHFAAEGSLTQTLTSNLKLSGGGTLVSGQLTTDFAGEWTYGVDIAGEARMIQSDSKRFFGEFDLDGGRKAKVDYSLSVPLLTFEDSKEAERLAALNRIKAKIKIFHEKFPKRKNSPEEVDSLMKLANDADWAIVLRGITSDGGLTIDRKYYDFGKYFRYRQLAMYFGRA